MARQGFHLQLTRFDERGWRATFYTTGMEHSQTTAAGTGWERPWHARLSGWLWQAKATLGPKLAVRASAGPDCLTVFQSMKQPRTSAHVRIRVACADIGMRRSHGEPENKSVWSTGELTGHDRFGFDVEIRQVSIGYRIADRPFRWAASRSWSRSQALRLQLRRFCRCVQQMEKRLEIHSVTLRVLAYRLGRVLEVELPWLRYGERPVLDKTPRQRADDAAERRSPS
jgi:hypothetical protein